MRKFLALFFALIFLVPVVAVSADLRSNILPKVAVKNTSNSGNTATTGEIIDTRGFRSVTFLIMTGTLADSDMTLTPSFQVCAIDNCDDAAAQTTRLTNTIASATFAATDDDTVKSIGIVPSQRYIRMVLTPANNSSAAAYEAICVLGDPKTGPAQ